MKAIPRLLCSLGLIGTLLLIGRDPNQVSLATSGEQTWTVRGGTAAHALAPYPPDPNAPLPSFDDDSPGHPASSWAQASKRVAGSVSNALPCLAIGIDVPAPTSGVVHLSWGGQSTSGGQGTSGGQSTSEGRIERARLVLTVSGAEAAHAILVNGHPVAQVPIYPGGVPCGAPSDGGEAFYLDIPPEIVVNGENHIQITASGDSRDSWTAANVRLEALGDLSLDVADGAQPGGVEPAAAQAQVFSFTFTNAYDRSTQEAIAQIPTGYDDGVPTPLVIYAHGRSAVMEAGIDILGDAANAQGWLLASPQMHGSWTGDPQPDPPGKYAYASLESQYDIAGTVRYMVEHFNVQRDRIYLVGYSMGGQIATVTAAKFPHVFAAVFDNKGPTDMAVWYTEQAPRHQDWMERECHVNGVPKTPAENSFCYQRRSSVSFARNYAHVPISITHSLADQLVPPHHSSDLYTRIKAYYPNHPVAVYWDRTQGPTCPPYYHCLEPDPGAVLDFLGAHTLQADPARIHITSDEPKSYYWLDLDQTGSEPWVHVLQAAYDRTHARVTAILSTTSPVQVGLNLGATPIVGPAGISQPGIGLPPTRYRVEVNGQSYTQDYAFGYLTVPLPAAGRFNVTLAALSFCDTAGLIRAIERANGSGQAVTLRLERGCTYVLSEVNNRTDGANGLPSIRGEITIEGSGATIERSRAAGAPDLRLFHVASGGSLTLQEIALDNGSADYGGAIYNRGGTVKLIDSTLSGHKATYGGAIYSRSGGVELINSTLSGNQAGDQGGGISNREGALALVGSTIARNRAGSGGGIYLASRATMSLRNTIVAGNLSGGDCEIVRASGVTSGGYNLDGDDTCGLDPRLGDRPNVDPGLGLLMNYGGATPTHALYANSPAVDRIPQGVNGCGASPLDEDQRGQGRPADGNGDGASVCDVGAFERQQGETLIGLLSWTAEARVGYVRLSWQTGIEANNVGFDLWRGETADGAYVQINPARIPAQGSASSGASYSYVDADVLGDAYYYWLEAVNAYGHSTYYGPVLARLGWVQRSYLPFVHRP